MKTLKLTAKDFKKSTSYWKDYIGKEDVSDFQGHIEIEGNLSYVRFEKLKALGHIWAEAGTGIKAGEGIEAGEGIKAGTGIKAGWGIEAGWSIKCKFTLCIGLRIFAGLCLWRTPTQDELLIECGKLEKGEVCYGTLKEIGMPEEEKPEVSLKGKTVEVTLYGKTYTAVIQ